MGGSCDRGEASAFPALSQSRNVAAAAPGFVVLYPGCASPPNHPQSLTTPKKTNPQIATVHFISLSADFLQQLYFENHPGRVGNTVPQY